MPATGARQTWRPALATTEQDRRERLARRIAGWHSSPFMQAEREARAAADAARARQAAQQAFRDRSAQRERERQAEAERVRVDRLEHAVAEEQARRQLEESQRQRAVHLQYRAQLIDEMGAIINPPPQPEPAERYVPAFGLDFGPLTPPEKG